MPTAIIVGLVFAVALASAFVTWFVQRNQTAAAVRQKEAEIATAVAVRDAQLESSAFQVTELRNKVDQYSAEMANLRARGDREAELRAAAEARVQSAETQIAQREAGIKERDTLLDARARQLTDLNGEFLALQTRMAEQEKWMAEQKKLLTETEKMLTDKFTSLSTNALNLNNKSFLQLAKQEFEKLHEVSKGDLDKRQTAVEQMVKPLNETLSKVETTIQEVEKDRAKTTGELKTQIDGLLGAQATLQKETANLVTALRAPVVRGRWGEIQLRRVVEMAGMIQYCDFEEQVNTETENGRLRPDMVVRLPNDRLIVVDSKVPLEAYLRSLDAPDEPTRVACLKDHATQIRRHIQQLSNKKYWDQFEQSPEFVILFLPGETFYSAALEQDPMLIEFGVDQKVLISTPTTLIALLKAVAYGWRQEQITENARKISQLGREMYDRVGVMARYFSEMRNHLDKTVIAYNRAAGSMETRLLVTARKFPELGVGAPDALPSVDLIDATTRRLDAPDMVSEILEQGDGHTDPPQIQA